MIEVTLDEACLLARRLGDEAAVLYDPERGTVVIVEPAEEDDSA